MFKEKADELLKFAKQVSKDPKSDENDRKLAYILEKNIGQYLIHKGYVKPNDEKFDIEELENS